MGRKLNLCCACAVALLALLMGATAPAQAKKRTLNKELAALLASGAIDQVAYDTHRATIAGVRAELRRLTGTRRAELAGAYAVVKGIAKRGDLRGTRLPVVMLELQRNLEYWPAQPLLASGQRIVFDGSELVWQQVPGQGVHLHPLANFGKLNAYARNRRQGGRTAQLLDELLAVAVPRGGGLAWEYYFTFDGGRGPWISGLSQGTALQAVARSAVRLDRLEELRPVISEGLEMFEKAPPTGVRVQTDAGAHYAQYSFWPSLRIANGFAQSLVGLYDVAQITGDPRAQALFAAGDAQGRLELPTYDTGAWSLYSLGAISRESDLGYHSLLRDFLANLCDRTAAREYCDTATRYTDYLEQPPVLELRTTRLRGGKPGQLRFDLDKISTASVVVTAADGRQVVSAALGRVGRGLRSVAWTPPRKGGDFTLRVEAIDLAGNPATVEGPLEVVKARRRG
jgi:D-glucuronyl C5-epimerase C-terminus